MGIMSADDVLMWLNSAVIEDVGGRLYSSPGSTPSMGVAKPNESSMDVGNMADAVM
jgi:hypothetical protein